MPLFRGHLPDIPLNICSSFSSANWGFDRLFSIFANPLPFLESLVLLSLILSIHTDMRNLEVERAMMFQGQSSPSACSLVFFFIEARTNNLHHSIAWVESNAKNNAVPKVIKLVHTPVAVVVFLFLVSNLKQSICQSFPLWSPSLPLQNSKKSSKKENYS